ncbi:MAG: hypothetical protein ACI8QS_001485 [Planctomycetota bacterium]|jgi:hypothetical protein
MLSARKIGDFIIGTSLEKSRARVGRPWGRSFANSGDVGLPRPLRMFRWNVHEGITGSRHRLLSGEVATEWGGRYSSAVKERTVQAGLLLNGTIVVFPIDASGFGLESTSGWRPI